MGRLGHETPRRLAVVSAAAAVAAGLAALAVGGCGGEETPEAAFDRLRRVLSSKVPDGWRVAYARDVTFATLSPTGPDDLVVYKAEPVRLQVRPPAPPPDPNPGVIYLALRLKPFIPPDQYADLWRKNETLRKTHERVLHTVANVPRDKQGRLMPRGKVESQQVARFQAEYAALPPYDRDMPAHYFGIAGVRVHDLRTVLVPVDRAWQQEMNQAYVQIILALAEYDR